MNYKQLVLGVGLASCMAVSPFAGAGNKIPVWLPGGDLSKAVLQSDGGCASFKLGSNNKSYGEIVVNTTQSCSITLRPTGEVEDENKMVVLDVTHIPTNSSLMLVRIGASKGYPSVQQNQYFCFISSSEASQVDIPTESGSTETVMACGNAKMIELK